MHAFLHGLSSQNYIANWSYQCESTFFGSNINHKGLQRTANECAEERRIYEDLIGKDEK